MKAGILTFHDADNYGAVLQAYALTEWLKLNGVDAEIVDYRSSVFDKYKVFRTNKYRTAPYLLGVDILKCVGKSKRSRNFKAFRERFLPVSAEMYSTPRDFEGIINKYDYFICGSDQIWNPLITKSIDPVYFLYFIDDPQKKIAYAPSVALDRLTEFQLETMAGYMSSFGALSMREQGSIDLLQPYCEKEIVRVCDPVFLPDRSCYNRICSPQSGKENFIFLYVVGRAAKFNNVITYAEKKAKEKNLTLYYLIDGDKSFRHIQGKNVFGCEPGEFLSLVKNATYIVSNSFHATAFSIIFMKQFITFLKDSTGSRMVNLLRSFHLEDRIFHDSEKGDILACEIDYRDMDDKLQSYRKGSADYLLRALHNRQDIEGETQADEQQLLRRHAYQELHSFVENRRHVYLARHTDSHVVRKSRSGGVFTAFSDVFFRDSGVVYGCRMENNSTAIHQRAISPEERDSFRGSKYIQSDMRDCFRQVREDLRSGRSVLFTGTPCSVAGLYSFLKKEDVSHLFTIDIICHGVPSQKIWSDYLTWMQNKHGREITAVNFRDKKFGWKAHFETVTIGEKEYSTSVFKRLFYSEAYLRPSCYNCRFANLKRKGDITIGDAWGVEKTDSRLNDDKGCSIVLVNSDKGRGLLDRCRQDLIIEDADLEKFMQPHLCYPSQQPSGRQACWDYYKKNGFDALVKRYGTPRLPRRIKDLKVIWLAKLHGNRYDS